MGCIPKYVVDNFLQRLKSGEIKPEKLSKMSSQERRDYFASFMGEANAKFVNATFESKLLLKNQQLGMVNWAKKIVGIKEDVKRDILSKVGRMTEVLQPEQQEAFLADLAAKRLGFDVTVEEAGKIADLAKQTADAKTTIPENSPNGSAERMDYGTKLAVFKQYVGGLKREAKAPQGLMEWLKRPGDIITEIAGATKSIAASLDNSFFGRQGLVTLITQPKIWGPSFVKSFGDISKELKGLDAKTPIQAEVWSRENAINGTYKKMGLDIGIESEEEFPSALPERIPIFGRLFKASESAYNGAALRIRADLADKLIEDAAANGVDVEDVEQAKGIGHLINSMTGRGSTASMLTPKLARLTNVLVFSIKYVKSQVDILTGHLFDSKATPYARKQAAKNLVKVIGTLGGILATSKMLDPESVELDPRSSRFGKIWVGEDHDRSINISAGFNSIITLASRIVPTKHRGEWGFWRKTTKGRMKRIGTGKYGDRGPTDLIADFMTGKASPTARTLLNYWEGRTFEGEKPTVKTEAERLIKPIPYQNVEELLRTGAGADPLLFSILVGLDLIGVATGTSYETRQRFKD